MGKARYDKYDPFSGGFRAALNADWSSNDVGVPFGVGLNANGRVVKGAGQTGVLAVLVIDSVKNAGDIVDSMTSGEIVDLESLTAGTAYWVNNSTGALETTAPGAGANKTRVGATVEASRMVVRVQTLQGA